MYPPGSRGEDTGRRGSPHGKPDAQKASGEGPPAGGTLSLRRLWSGTERKCPDRVPTLGSALRECHPWSQSPHPPSKSPSRVLATSSEDDRVSWHRAQSSKAALRRVWVTGRERVTAGVHAPHLSLVGALQCCRQRLSSLSPPRTHSARSQTLQPLPTAPVGCSSLGAPSPGQVPWTVNPEAWTQREGPTILAYRASSCHVPFRNCDVPESSPAQNSLAIAGSAAWWLGGNAASSGRQNWVGTRDRLLLPLPADGALLG